MKAITAALAFVLLVTTAGVQAAEVLDDRALDLATAGASTVGTPVPVFKPGKGEPAIVKNVKGKPSTATGIPPNQASVYKGNTPKKR